MALAPVSYFSDPMEDYPGNWIKFYEQGTTTPLSMATDSSAGTLLAKAEISSGGTVPIGFVKTAGDAIFIPWVDGDYDLFLFPTEAEADANDTSNAIQLADDINADGIAILEGSLGGAPLIYEDTDARYSALFLNTTEMIALSPIDSVSYNNTVGNILKTTGRYLGGDDGDGEYIVKTAAQASTDGDTIDEFGLGFTLSDATVAVLNHRGTVYARQFGANSDEANTANLQAFLDAVGDNQLKGDLGRGSFAFNADIFFHRNCNISGVGHSFGSALVPYDGARIRFDGDQETGGFVFHASLKDCVVNGLQSTLSVDDLIYVNKCFSIDFSGLRSENLNTSVDNTLMHIEFSNDINIYSPILFGTTNASGRGIVVGDDSTVKIYKPDVEVINKGIRIDGNDATVVDVFGIYEERCISGVQCIGGHLNLFGGKIENPSASAVAGLLNSKTKVYGTDVVLTGGLGLTSTASTNPECEFYGVDNDVLAGDWFTGSNVAPVKGDSFSYENYLVFRDLADDTYTDIFTFDQSAVNKPCKFKVELWATAAGFGKAYKTFTFLSVKPSGGSHELSLIDEVTHETTTSANWEIDVFMDTTLATNATTVRGKITGIGALAIGNPEDLYVKVTATVFENTAKLITE